MKNAIGKNRTLSFHRRALAITVGRGKRTGKPPTSDQADREAADIRFSNRLPIKHNRFVPGGSKSRKLAELNFETDPHRAIGCNMQKAIEAAVDKIGDAGDLSRERKLIFARQVEEEERKELVKLLGDRGVLRVDWPGLTAWARPWALLGTVAAGCRQPG